ncbi:uncharacterized protein PHACADRAFT_167062 [Phanerochaete carnosa HHB-10118-sp]|uniref:Uncharacterized protein n=1 Tax=Phanerochaete carnosa (strain HHB-10118-sp) TaxID=650164 RepID=K5WHK1_PHACS|nr:uncharacterized protein PHACADRAFT_167062 [Phanerochaete carnosa HHB-10118-sp]EKM49707.1 hypothetical protein PHACADRAFT_167062 [Phanerochaete carnosa HHB-10118-sp]
MATLVSIALVLRPSIAEATPTPVFFSDIQTPSVDTNDRMFAFLYARGLKTITFVQRTIVPEISEDGRKVKRGFYPLGW